MTVWKSLGFMLGKMWLWLAMITVKWHAMKSRRLLPWLFLLHDIGYKACQIIIGISDKEEVELDNGNCFGSVFLVFEER